MKNLPQKLLLVFLSIGLTLVLVEVVFRVLDIRGYHQPRTRDWEHALLPEDDLLPGVKNQFKPDSSFELNYDSNPRGLLRSEQRADLPPQQSRFSGAGY